LSVQFLFCEVENIYQINKIYLNQNLINKSVKNRNDINYKRQTICKMKGSQKCLPIEIRNDIVKIFQQSINADSEKLT
jgi:hypothetical protein